MVVILSCAKPCNVATLNPGVQRLCVSVYCTPTPPFKASFQSESCGPWLTAGLISAEISPIFYLLLNIYSLLNPVSLSVSEASVRLTGWRGSCEQQIRMHICEMPGVLSSLSANREANEVLEVRCQSWRATVHVHHPQSWMKIGIIYSQSQLLNGLESANDSSNMAHY